MFKNLGRFVEHYRFPLLIGWILVAVLVTLLAPNLDDIATNDNSDFLPDDAPSIEGRALVEEYFPADLRSGSVTVVFHVQEGQSITDPANMAFIGEVSTWLVSEDAPEGIAGVMSPTLNPEAAAALIAPDQEIAIVSVLLSVSEGEAQLVVLEAIGEQLEAAPTGMKTYQTGESAIFRAYDEVITESVDRTLFVTLGLVVFVLLLIYRSPVSPFIPLTVVTVAYLIARGIVAWMGQNEVFTVSGTASTLLIVVMYGSGTDFCLFLVNRFREELARSHNRTRAVSEIVHRVGESIASGAGTIMAGFLAMTTAQLGLFNTTGPALAIGVAVSVLAGLTLTPAILGLLGERAFYPGGAKTRETGIWYKRTSQLVSSRPLLTITVIVLVMSPLMYYGSQQEATYDTLADLPAEIEAVEGFRVLEDHLGPGNLQPLTVVSELSSETPRDQFGEAQALTAVLLEVDGVAAVRSVSQPLGTPLPEGTSATITPEMMAQMQPYLNMEAGAARFEVLLADNPFSHQAQETVTNLRAVLSDIPGDDAIVGTTAIQTDLRDILAEDMRLTIGLVLAGIFVVLILMLRSIVAPMYLVATILLSYGTTLGITRLFSNLFWGTDELTWWVPFFMFVFLVALGIDYSIFLFGRIKEEVARHGIHDGIHHAVQATGSIITSAGIIVAGTFGAMMTGDIRGLAQIGFAVSVGILLDTFVVRTILDPALATLFGRWTWFPGGIPQLEPAHSEQSEHGAILEPGGAD